MAGVSSVQTENRFTDRPPDSVLALSLTRVALGSLLRLSRPQLLVYNRGYCYRLRRAAVKIRDSDYKVSGTQKVILKGSGLIQWVNGCWVHFLWVPRLRAHSLQSSLSRPTWHLPVYHPVCLEASPTWLHSSEALLSFKAHFNAPPSCCLT